MYLFCIKFILWTEFHKTFHTLWDHVFHEWPTDRLVSSNRQTTFGKAHLHTHKDGILIDYMDIIWNHELNVICMSMLYITTSIMYFNK